MKQNHGFYLTALNPQQHGSSALRSRFNNRNRNPLLSENVRSSPAKAAKSKAPKLYKSKLEKKAMKRAHARMLKAQLT